MFPEVLLRFCPAGGRFAESTVIQAVEAGWREITVRGPERRLGGIGRPKFMVPGGQGVMYFLDSGVKSYPPLGEAQEGQRAVSIRTG